MHKTWMILGGLVILLTLLVSCQQITPTVHIVPEAQPSPSAIPTAQDGVLVALSASTSELAVGDVMVITVEVHRVKNLMGAEVHVQFDPTRLQVVDTDQDIEGVEIVHGEFLQPDFVAINMVDNNSGVVDYAIAQMPPNTAVEGNGDICKIQLEATASGSTSVLINSVVLADAGAQEIPAVLVNEKLDIDIK